MEVVGERHAEVDYLHLVALLGDEDVAGLQVAVLDVSLVGISYGGGNLSDDVELLLHRVVLGQVGVERPSVDKLHHDGLAVLWVVDELRLLGYVGVVELRHGLKLLTQQRLELRLVLVFTFQSLQHHRRTIAGGFHIKVDTL